MSDAQKLPALPAITSPLAPDVKMWIDAATAIITALTAQNPKASGLDAAITFRDLTNSTGMKVTAVQTAQTNKKPTLNITA